MYEQAAMGDDPEDVYVTSCYYIQKEFGYTIEEMRQLPVGTYLVLIEEMRKESERIKSGGYSESVATFR